MRLVELVNPKVFHRGFERSMEYGPYTLVATPGYFRYGQKPGEPSDQFRIEARKGRVMVGWVNFENIDDNLEALDLHIDPKHRRKGIATAMYKFAKELGNSISPSSKQTAMGKLFWNKDHSQ